MRIIAKLIFAACLACGAEAGAAPPLEDYGKLPAVEDMALSPAGDLIAYTAVDGDTRKVVVRQFDGPALRAVDAGQLKLGSLRWMDNRRLLIEFTSDLNNPGGPVSWFAVGQSAIFDVQTGQLRKVFDRQELIMHATFGYYGSSKTGERTFGYFGGLTLAGGGDSAASGTHNSGYVSDSSKVELYKVDLDSGHAERVAGGSSRVSSEWVVAANGDIIGHETYDQRSGQWRLYDSPDDRHLLETESNPVGDYGLIGQGRTPGSLLVWRPNDSGDWSYLEYSKDGGKRESFAGISVRYPLFDNITGLLIGGVTEGDEPKTLLFDTAVQTKFDKASRAFPGETAALLSATSSLDRMIILTEGPKDSGTYFKVDYPNRKVEAIGWRYPSILLDSVAPTQVITYKSADGTGLQGILTLPIGRVAKGLPLVVMPHGGPVARDYLSFDWWAQAFASRGYAVFQPNFRGSDGFGKAFRDAGFGQWGRKMQTDISDGVADLASRGVIDAKRACIVGASYGGYAALAGVTVQHGLYRCAVAVAGIGDLNSFLAWLEQKYGEESGATRMNHEMLGVRSSGDPSLQALSPQHLASQADAPILLLHGKEDTIVPVTQSWTMRDALKAAGKTVEFVQLAGEDHHLYRQATRIEMLTASVAFVEKYNPPN